MQLDLLGFHRAIAGEMAITREERMEKKKKKNGAAIKRGGKNGSCD